MRLQTIMLLLFLFSCIVAICMIDMVEAKDNAKMMLGPTLSSIKECYDIRDKCETCYQQCSDSRQAFFMNDMKKSLETLTNLERCRMSISDVRVGMEPWCLNDEKKFYATDEFKPSEETCKVDPRWCARRIPGVYIDRRKEGKIHANNPDIALSKKLKEVGKVYEKYLKDEEWYLKEKKKIKAIQKWYTDDILKELEDHLNHPDENYTRFNDPVFFDYEAMKTEMKKIDALIKRTDVNKALSETVRVRNWTTDVIVSNINQLLELKHDVKSESKKEEANLYLKEIKDLVTKTYEAQKRATNFAFETAHKSELKKEITVFDEQLLDKLEALREARGVLTQEMTASMKQKLKLVTSLRGMIATISQEQRKRNCNNMFSLPD